MVREIPLTRGYVALVDDEDYERVNAHRWYANPKIHLDGSTTIYGLMFERVNGKRIGRLLHRFILNPPKHVHVDHRDGNGLNCTRANLRHADKSLNGANQRIKSNNTSGFKGVSVSGQAWRVYIGFRGRQQYLGTYESIEFAAAVYDAAARHLFGPFALTNFDIPNPDAEAIIAARFAESEAA